VYRKDNDMSVRRSVIPLVAALVALTGLTAPLATAAPTAPTGWIRLAHLSPKAPAVDIYLAQFGQAEHVIVRNAPYGAVTGYSTLAPGVYTVSMRVASAPADSPVALSQVIELKAGSAQSLLVFETGPNGGLQGKLVTDELTPPTSGTGRLRLVQGAEGSPVSITANGGPELAREVTYGTTTPYTDVPAGHWDLSLASGNVKDTAGVDVAAGSVTTVLVVLKDGKLTVTPVADSTATATAPTGGVQTGAGGTADPPITLWILAAVLAATALAGADAARKVRA
jgi:hypothetical protein